MEKTSHINIGLRSIFKCIDLVRWVSKKTRQKLSNRNCLNLWYRRLGMRKSTTRYDKIGIGYDKSRNADKYLVERMYDNIYLGKEDKTYLDIGCGTGNYTSALSNKGLDKIGVDHRKKC